MLSAGNSLISDSTLEAAKLAVNPFLLQLEDHIRASLFKIRGVQVDLGIRLFALPPRS